MDYLCEHLSELQLIAIWAASILFTNTITFMCGRKRRNSYNRL